MPSPNRQAKAAVDLLGATGNASASVIASRLLAFSDATTAMSPWHQTEARRMVEEKVDAMQSGMLAASAELAMLPFRMLTLFTPAAMRTPTHSMNSWLAATDLWFGVGNAALRPAKATAVRNRRRLSRTRG